jgi:hypothetical protein
MREKLREKPLFGLDHPLREDVELGPDTDA